jgi:2'-5' RNA ligase
MRLFAALPVGGEAGAELARWLARFQGRGWPVRWVRPEGLHLTLKFLGTVEESRVPAVEQAFVAACVGTPSLSLSLRDFGTFPAARRPRVIWAGLEADPALELLAHRLESQFEAVGFPVEGRPFRPHVTLGRVKEGKWLPGDVAAELQEAHPAASHLADRVVLFESQPAAGGARYRVVREVRLAS